MENRIKKVFFSVALFCSCYAHGSQFESLKQRSPFGDAPKPEPKPKDKQPVKVAAPVAPPAPQKPELKLSFLGYVRIGNKNYFSICDKTSKDEIHTLLTSEQKSPYGYAPSQFNEKKKTLEIEVNNYNYSCPLGEEAKSDKGGENKSDKASKGQPSYGSGPYGAPSINYDFSWDDDWDDWDDWD
ncbi:MAG: hypothetical protein LBI77_03990 [Puniceicoccales bacterium]|jgi:hypothetical protein|nr:hypothetical protein [Puniceicoccales bacterium]